jgi:probable phosphoglycerate mutase
MCRILLIRHAEHALIGEKLVGRDEAAVRLSERGQKQAAAVAESLIDETIDCLQSSPRLRCIETAGALATRFDLPVLVAEALDEIDFGVWTGTSFEMLEQDPKWHAWNVRRAHTPPPGGESMGDALARVLRHLQRMSRRRPTGTIAMVTHAEIIRAVKLHQAGLSPDAWQSIDVPLASVTAIEMTLSAMVEDLFEAAAS